MSSDLVEPLPGVEAFERPATTRDVAVSQALQVLAIGAQLSGYGDVVLPPGADALRRRLDIPNVPPLDGRVITSQECAEYVARFDPLMAGMLTTGRPIPVPPDVQSQLRYMLWRDVRRNPEQYDRQVAAKALLLTSVYAVDEIDVLRVAAASELTWRDGRNGNRDRALEADTTAAVRSTLEAGLASSDEDVQLIADNALNEIGQDQEPVAWPSELPQPADNDEVPGGEPARPDESVIVHGTWANRGNSPWWLPRHGDFHRLLAAHPLGSGLYDGEDPFEWSGSLKDHQREVAGKALRWWVDRPGGSGRLKAAFAHSHGGTVTLWAVANRELRIRLLVALACPAYAWTAQQQRAIAKRVDAIVSVRASIDPVLWADRRLPFLSGGRRNDRALPGEHDIELKGVGHSGVHDPQVWQDQDVADQVLEAAQELGWSP